MNPVAPAATRAGADAALAAALLAVDPAGLGGAVVRGPAGESRDRWLQALRALLPPETPFKRIPLHVTDERLLGGLDLGSTLRTGRRMLQRGLLAESDGGIAVLAMAERVSASTAARIAAALDTHSVALERDGLTARMDARLGLIALDEGLDADEAAPAVIRERLAFHLDFTELPAREPMQPEFDAAAVAAAREMLANVTVLPAVIEALAGTAAALGVHSARGAWLALKAARALAALCGVTVVSEAEAAAAARLVLGPRATQIPQMPEEAPPDQPPANDAAPPDEPPPDREDPRDESEPPAPTAEELADKVLEAAAASIPAGLLASLASLAGRPRRGRSSGRVGEARQSAVRGRPIGTRAGAPERGARLDLLETLRTAAPWQPLRRRLAGDRGDQRSGHVHIERSDFRIKRFEERSETTTIFVVDASGSSALHRLAEAKGAVELLLADCYVRRDQVAVIAFRGMKAEVLLPPTRSLVRAKRALAGLPGGGGTPLAAGVDAALEVAAGVRRRGGTPTVVLLTDGRANIARDLSPGRARAELDAISAVRAVRLAGVTSLLIDTSPRAQPLAAKLAAEMCATYLPLPQADAQALNRAVRAVARSAQ